MRLLSSFFALALSTSAALASDIGPLLPGSPAGVKHAQESNNAFVFGVLAAGAIAGFVVALTSGSNSGPTPMAPSNTSIASTV